MDRNTALLSILIAAAWCANAGAQTAPAAGSTDSLAASNGRFAVDLYREIGTRREGNLFLSPYSVSSALAMVWAGGRGETGEEIARVLHLTALPQTVNAGMRGLKASLEEIARKGDVEFAIANRLWGDRSHPFLPDYVASTRETYGAALETLDFQGAPDAAREAINRWVEETTKERIRDLLPSGSIGATTRLVLTNAIYFKGKWARPFPEGATREEPFHAPAGEVTVPMMHETLKAGVGIVDGGRLLLLPYVGDALSMVILLPDEVDGLAALEKGLAWQELSRSIEGVSRKEVILSLPRFRTTSSFTLSETLEEMGMRSAFDPAKADFSGIDGKRDLFISLIVHKAFVEVAEQGTEAAAATGIVVGITSVSPVEKPVTFVVDHPFLFLIRDNASGSILFMGRITNPLS